MSEQENAPDPLIALESEKCLLGSLMLAPERFDEVRELLSEQSFQHKGHRALWSAFCALWPNCCDFVALGMELERRGLLEALGGNGFLLRVAESVTSTAHMKYHAGVLERATRLRAMRSHIQRLASEIGEVRLAVPGDAEAFIDDATRAIADLSVARDDVSTSEPAFEPATRVVEVWSNPIERRGLMTGIERLDRVLGGIESGNMTVFAARPSRGKTAIALQIALNMALDGIPCVFVTMEMTREQIAARAVACLASISLRKARAGRATPEEIERARYAATKTLADMPLTLLTPRKRDYKILRPILRRSRGVQAVFVDYLQLFNGEQRDRFQQVGAASTECKALAMEFDTRMIVMSQLSREAERERPNMGHMRESGNIEQDANQIVLLSFQSEPGERPDPKRVDCALMADVAKNRDGRTDEVMLDWNRATGSIQGSLTQAEALFHDD